MGSQKVKTVCNLSNDRSISENNKQQRNFTSIGEDQKSRSKLIFVVPILRIENFEKVMDYLYTHQLKKTRVKKNIYTFGKYAFVNISDNVKVPRNDEYLDFS